MYVCMYVCMYVSLSIHIYIYIHILLYYDYIIIYTTTILYVYTRQDVDILVTGLTPETAYPFVYCYAEELLAFRVDYGSC